MKRFLDWSAYRDAGMGDAYADIPKQGGDFAKAVAVCIGSRRCEERHKGVMCPSYRVSGAAELATGGRVRLLKRALNGEAPAAEMARDPELDRAMDLCLSCKGCRRECENGVDMARIKIEYLAQRNALFGVPRRARLLAALPRLLAHPLWGPLVGPASRLRNRIPLLARLLERLTGIAAEVALPLPDPRPLQADGSPVAAGDGERRVVLLADTFNRHYTPRVTEAALRLLEAAGYRVIPARPAPGDDEPERPLCCGRTHLTHGLVEEARGEARRMVAALHPLAAEGVPIIGLEPSCLLTLRDEYSALGLGEAAEVVAGQALLLEEFLAREATAKRLRLPLARAVESVVVHGHCHQKAVGAMKSMRKVLKLIPGLEFELIDASCCGMAGGFGLEAEHRRHADAMAGLALLPALAQVPTATVVTTGFSCRCQIENHSGRRPLHLAELLASRIAS